MTFFGCKGEGSSFWAPGHMTPWSPSQSELVIRSVVSDFWRPHGTHQFPLYGILQARILEWVAILFFRGSSRLRDQAHISCIAGRFFTAEPPGKPILWSYITKLTIIHQHSEILVPISFSQLVLKNVILCLIGLNQDSNKLYTLNMLLFLLCSL